MNKQKISCIYLTAQAIHDGKKLHYLVKVGRTNDLQNRLQVYLSHNPFARIVEIMPTDKDETKTLEKQAHTIMHTKYLTVPGCAEWFECSKKEYNKIIKNGFDYILK